MKLLVNPNRMELLKLKRRLQFAVRGHKLLKDKQESLMQEFMRILKELKGLYAGMEVDLDATYESFYQAQAGAEPFALEEALEPAQSPAKVEITLKNKLGRKMPFFETKVEKTINYDAGLAPLAIGGLLDNLYQVFPKLVFLAQVEKQIEMLSREIEKTRRRVNALEYNLIPILKDTIREIVMKLEERDRAERTTLMKVKDMLVNR